MAKIVVVFWSQTGNTETMAKAIAEGAGNCDIFNVSDFDAQKLLTYDSIAFGCPAMGNEELEDSEFEPFFENSLPFLKGKRIALFGSYDWGDGEWMRSWQQHIEAQGINLIQDGLICNNTPGEKEIVECKALGKALTE